MTKKRVLSLLLVLCLVMSLTVVASAASYNDVAGDAWYADAVQRWSDYGIVQGDETGFRPNDNMTRAEAAAVFTRLLGLDSTDGAVKFTDVPATAWYAPYIDQVSAAGIMNGTSSNPDYPTASPNATITRQEFFVLFARAIGMEETYVTENPLADDDEIASWARGLITTMIDEGYVQGTGNSIDAKANITRAQVMALLNQTIDEYYGAPNGGSAASGTREAGYTYASQKAAGSHGKMALASRRVDSQTFTGVYGRIASFARNLILNAVQVAKASNMAPGSRVNFTNGSKVESIYASKQASGATYNVDKSSAVSTITADSENTSVTGTGVVAEFNASTLDNNVTTPGTAVTETKVTENADGSTDTEQVATKNDENGKKTNVVKTVTTMVTSSDGSLSYDQTKTVTDPSGKEVSKVVTTSTATTNADGSTTVDKTVTATELQADGSTLTTTETSNVTTTEAADGSITVATKSEVTSERKDTEGKVLYSNKTTTEDTTTVQANGDTKSDTKVELEATTLDDKGNAVTVRESKTSKTSTSTAADGTVTNTKDETVVATDKDGKTTETKTQETTETKVSMDGTTTEKVTGTYTVDGTTTTKESTTTTKTEENGNVTKTVTAEEKDAAGKTISKTETTSVSETKADGTVATKTTGSTTDADGKVTQINTVTSVSTNSDGTVTTITKDNITGKTTESTATTSGTVLVEQEVTASISVVDVTTEGDNTSTTTPSDTTPEPSPSTSPSTSGDSSSSSGGGGGSYTPSPTTPVTTVTVDTAVTSAVNSAYNVVKDTGILTVEKSGTTINITVNDKSATFNDVYKMEESLVSSLQSAAGTTYKVSSIKVGDNTLPVNTSIGAAEVNKFIKDVTSGDRYAYLIDYVGKTYSVTVTGVDTVTYTVNIK